MEDRTMRIDPTELEGDEAYHLINALVVPRPIAWVSTVSAEGVPNLAPFSYFAPLSPRPPIICFSATGPRDTLRNIEHTNDFVVNVVPESLAHEMNVSAADFPPDESEFDAVGLSPVPSEVVHSPRVLESPASLECVVEKRFQVGDVPSTVVVGRVVRIHLAFDIVVDGRVSAGTFRPLGRLAGSWYVQFGEMIRLVRPHYTDLLIPPTDTTTRTS